jgi:NADPH:quinone reductase-like Zn-dependent oxidoreductase
MRALRFRAHGRPEVLEVTKLPVPRPGPGEVLLRVRSASVNPVDVGLVAMPLPFVPELRLPVVPGWDVAGTVVMRGPGTEAFSVGDEVFGLSRFPRLTHGTFAEYTTVSGDDLARKPPELPWDQAGALPLVGLTTLQAFDAVGGITPGTRVLVEAAAGGTGHVAVQIAKAAGATVIGTWRPRTGPACGASLTWSAHGSSTSKSPGPIPSVGPSTHSGRSGPGTPGARSSWCQGPDGGINGRPYPPR